MTYVIWGILSAICFGILYFFPNIDEGKRLLFLGLFGGVCLSICQSWTIKKIDDKRHKKDQKEYVRKLRNTYLKEFREALKSLLGKYINLFKEETLQEYGFQDIISDNQIDIDKLISNLIKIQVCRDETLWDGKSYPKTIGERIQSKTNHLRIVFFYNCYDRDYAKLCKSVEKLRAIYEVEDPKYIFPIFESREKEMLESIDSEIYYANYSKDNEKQKEQKLDYSEVQMIVNEFTNYNKLIKIFDVNLNEKKENIPHSILEEAIAKILEEDQKKQKVYEKAKYEMEEILRKER
ncbi:hypothetical protein [Cetobacterium sp.]|uniref:hypothetical protein n=1 Tax=Cetobacterium sp. TaxID=2071632 RepID=UPI0025B98550|nr:hypothetical protein [Cetobacterium sp.]